MISFKQFTEAVTVVNDGSVHNVHYENKHIGNVFEPNSKGEWKAFSKHWDMKQIHKSKKKAVDWLVSIHKTAEKINTNAS